MIAEKKKSVKKWIRPQHKYLIPFLRELVLILLQSLDCSARLAQ